jgi:hypothetical protein
MSAFDNSLGTWLKRDSATNGKFAHSSGTERQDGFGSILATGAKPGSDCRRWTLFGIGLEADMRELGFDFAM